MRHLVLIFLALAGGLTGCRQDNSTLINGPWERHTIDNTSRGADGVKLADADGDGLTDIVTGWEQGGVVKVYFHPGPESVMEPWPSVIAGQAPNVEDAVFVDLDGNGVMDVVSSCEGNTQSMFVHWGPDDPSLYRLESAWKTDLLSASLNVTRWMFCIPVQIDGRHGIDLVAGSKQPNAVIGWFEAPESPRNLEEWLFHPMSEAGWVMSLFAQDMDGDGDEDVVVTDRKGGPLTGCRWLERPDSAPALRLPWTNHWIGQDEQEVMFGDLVDLDEDGRLDMVVSIKPKSLVWFRNSTGSNSQWDRYVTSMPENSGRAKSLAAGDIDLDGRIDYVFSCESASDLQGIMWMSYHNDPVDQHWGSHILSGAPGTKFDLVELLDIDGDGDLDVLTCEEGENLGVFWYENPMR